MCINIQKLSYIHSDKEILFNDFYFSVSKGDRIALVGDNGCGKSTLLKIIAGQLSPSSGTVTRIDNLYYIPQHFGQYDDQTIAQTLLIDKKVNALHAILSGDTSVEHYTLLDDDWNIEERSQAALDSWNLADYQLSQPMNSLSCGEKTRVFLAGMDIHSPSVILMDEPTNHLDNLGRERLYDFIRKCRITLVVVSHDRTLLNLLPMICELGQNKITTYGGNYEFYKEQKNIQQNALQQSLEEKEKEIRLTRKIAREMTERKEKQNVRGEKANIKKGIPRIAMGVLKDKAEKSTTRLNDIHKEKSEKLIDERNRIRGSLSPTASLKTDFNTSSLHSGKTLVNAHGLNYSYNEIPLWKTPLNFQLRSGDRLSIEGPNGSGKTSLLKLIIGELLPTDGMLTRAEFTSVYLNQEYSIIRNQWNVLEQATAYNTRDLQEHELKIILNRYLFPASVWNKSCKKLSGGEKMRLAFCCLMISNNTPDLFILDEPTNNLDIQSIEIITATIRDFRGTVIVVSHDPYFRKEINVERSIKL